ncbi:MAG: hypothetical protein Q4G27_08250 [Flavobacteriaceae bacterium]|nr:hypothetical protein [Flavobacteriaceae bacterium]
MDQFFGFVFFLIMALSGFWCLTFLVAIVPYWLGPGVAELNGKINANVDPEEVRFKKLYEQDGIEVLYQK